jgi:hypothetical protein
MNANYDAMIAYSPYFDTRQTRYNGEAFVYTDLYGLPVGDPRATDNPDWLLRTSTGASVYIPWGCAVAGGCPQYAADVGNAEFKVDFTARIGDLLARGYEGVIIDDVNLLRRFSDVNGQDVTPINPRTGAPMLMSEWRVAVVALLERVRAEYPDARIMHNSIWYADSPALDNPNVGRQIAAADVIMMERGATDPGLTGGTGTYSYAKFIAFIDRVHRLGADVLLLDQSATTYDEQLFNVATALLTSNGRDYVSTETVAHIAPGSIWSGFDVDLGDALGGHSEQSGLWRRDFERGFVLVNGPESLTRTVQLNGTFLTAEGSAVTQITLGPRDAAILRRP